jgi:hypothetical protein
MRDPNEIIALARQESAEPGWEIFTRKRGTIGAFFRGTSQDPDPMLVVTPDGVVEYISQQQPLAAVDFRALSRIRLQASATSHASTPGADLRVWLDLHDTDGRKIMWRPSSFKDDLLVLQSFIASFAVYQAGRPPG